MPRLTVDLVDSPVAEDIQGALRDEGLSRVAFAGMRVSGRLIGMLGLGWKSRTPTSPSGPVLLEAATLVASALENARLLRRVERGLELERSLTAPPPALVELTRLPDAADEEATIAQFLLERIVSVLGAASGSVARIVDGRLVGLASHRTPPPFAKLQNIAIGLRVGLPPAVRRAARRPIVQAIEPGTVSPEILAAAASVGLKAVRGVLVPRRGRRCAGVLICGFEQPASELPFDDRTIEAIGRVVDISFANQRLRRVAIASEERYRMVFERSPDALVVASLDGVVLEANPAAIEMFGGPIVGRSGLELAEVEPATMGEILQRVRDDAHEQLVGQRPPARRNDVPDRGRGDGPVGSAASCGSSASIRDLTERRRLQHELLQAQKMEAIGLLVAGVAHELNNPLASIVGVQPADPDRSAPARRAPPAGRPAHPGGEPDPPDRPEPARLRPPAAARSASRPRSAGSSSASSACSPTRFGPSRIEAELEIDEDLPLIALDRAQIQQVLINLTLNAAQAIRTRAERGQDHDPRRGRRGRGGGHRSSASRSPTTDPGSRRTSARGCSCRSSRRRRRAKAPARAVGVVRDRRRSRRLAPPRAGTGRRGATFILELPVDPGAADAVDDGWAWDEADADGRAGRPPDGGRRRHAAIRTPAARADPGPRPRRRARDPRLPRPGPSPRRLRADRRRRRRGPRSRSSGPSRPTRSCATTGWPA